MYSTCLNQYITFWKWIIAFEVEYQLLEPKFSQCKFRWYCRNQFKGLFSHLVLRNMHDVTILKVSLIKHFFVYQKCWYFLLLRIFFQDSNKNLYILRKLVQTLSIPCNLNKLTLPIFDKNLINLVYFLFWFLRSY